MQCTCHIAQINIARARAPMDDPLMAGFVARLDDINALADSSPGFVWRLQTEDGNATSVQAYEDPMMLVNLSVWKTPEDLKQFVFRSDHVNVMRQRRKWFEPLGDVPYALWWIEAGRIPSLSEARERLTYLQRNGESEFAFSFASLFKAPTAKADRDAVVAADDGKKRDSARLGENQPQLVGT